MNRIMEVVKSINDIGNATENRNAAYEVTEARLREIMNTQFALELVPYMIAPDEAVPWQTLIDVDKRVGGMTEKETLLMLHFIIMSKYKKKPARIEDDIITLRKQALNTNEDDSRANT